MPEKGKGKMKKAKKAGVLAVVILIIAVGFLIYHYFQTWPLRFRSDFNEFFGEGNWEQVSSETNESRMYTVYHRSSSPALSGERAGTYHNWDIAFTNRYGEEELWTITDLSLIHISVRKKTAWRLRCAVF